MPIRTKGTKLPLFCVHGQPLRMAQNTPADRPIYGLSHVYHSDFLDESPESIEEIAAKYLAEIRQVQPNGPYHFCGFSAGGLIAYEMAQQLLSIGETIGDLTLIEPTVVRNPDESSGQVKTPSTNKGGRPNFFLRLLTPKSLYVIVRHYFLLLASKLFFLFKIPLPETLRWLGYLRSLGPAMRKYTYRPLNCSATILYPKMKVEENKLWSEFWNHLLTQGAWVIAYTDVHKHGDFMQDHALKKIASLIETNIQQPD